MHIREENRSDGPLKIDRRVSVVLVSEYFYYATSKLYKEYQILNHCYQNNEGLQSYDIFQSIIICF